MTGERERDRTFVARDDVLRGIDGAAVERGDGTAVVRLHFVPSALQTGKAPVLRDDELARTPVRLEGPGALGWRVVGLTPAGDEPHTLALELARSAAAPPALAEPVVVRLAGLRDIAPGFDRVTVHLVAPGVPDDVEPAASLPVRVPASTQIDYLTKDYAGFRQLMLDRLSATLPAWSERHAADEGVALVELLAYAGDYLSYYQDAVATEAYLGTARRRTSVRRHARLLEYRLHEGCTPRVWLHVDVPSSGNPAQPKVLWLERGFRAGTINDPASQTPPSTFTSLEPARVRETNNVFDIYDYGLDTFALQPGATRAALLVPAQDPPSLEAGDVLIFEQAASPVTGVAADADPRLRQAVRLIARPRRIADPLRRAINVWEIVWHARDALAFALPVAARIGAGALRVDRLAHVLGNNIPADYGAPQNERLPDVPPQGPYRPQLQHHGVTFAVPYDTAAERTQPAAALTELVPYKAVADVQLTELYEAGVAWYPARDLLDAVRDASVFAVDADADGVATLRFGDGVYHGRVPHPGASFQAAYRTGNGPTGHLGPDVLVDVLAHPPLSDAHVEGLRVRNPLPPAGGQHPEDLDRVRTAAPLAARARKSAVVPADFVARAVELPGVRAAASGVAFTGSWRTVRVYVQSDAGGPGGESTAFLRSVRDALEPFRLANADLLVAGPAYVTVQLAMTIVTDPQLERERLRARVDASVAALLRARTFTFGETVYASPFVAAAMGVTGVLDARVERLGRVGVAQAPDAEAPAVHMAAHEIAHVARALVTFADEEPLA